MDTTQEDVDNAITEASDFFDQCVESGLTEDFSNILANHRLSSYVENKGIEHLDIARMIPLDVIIKKFASEGKDWNKIPKEEQRKVLWELGINTKKCDFFIKACCFTWNEKLQCGVAIIGNEREDDHWLNLLDDNGCNVASMEVRCKDLKGVAEVARNNKNWDDIAVAITAQNGESTNGNKEEIKYDE